MILSDERYFLANVGRALTYCDLFALARDELVAAVEPFALSAARLRRATVRLALCRHMTMTHRLLTGANSEKNIITSLGKTGSTDSEGQSQAKSITLATQLEQYNSGLGRAPSPTAGKYEERASTSELREVKDGIQTLHNEMGALRDQMDKLARLVERALPAQL